MEMGKDIIAIAPDGTPTAFQLKATGNTKVSKTVWRTELLPQVEELVTQAIDHPSVDTKKQHHPVLVINGEIEEETQAAIQQYNQGLSKRKIGKKGRLEVIVRGQLLKMFLELGANLVPSELEDEKTLLELYLMKGNESFPKKQFAGLLESILPLTDKSIKGPEQVRSITAAAIITALSLSSFSQAGNHLACFEAWTLYCSYILCLAEKRKMKEKDWEPAIRIGLQAMRTNLENLSEEVSNDRRLVAGDTLTDIPFYRIRIAHLCGLMSLLALWPQSETQNNSKEKRFVLDNLSKMLLWGEYAVPQFLATYFFLVRIDATLKPTAFLEVVLKGIAAMGNRDEGCQLAGPEVGPEEFVLDTLIRKEDERRHTYNRGSYTTEGLLHLFVRHNMKQQMKTLWPKICLVHRKTFTPEDISDYYRWHVEKGHDHSQYPEPTQSWRKLKVEADEHNGDAIPRLFKQYPYLYLAFLMVCPHRFSANGVRWLDSRVNSTEE